MIFHSFVRLFLIALAIFVPATNFFGHAAETNQPPSAEMEFNQANPKMIWSETTNFITGNPFSSAGNILIPMSTSLSLGFNARDGLIILTGKPLKVSSPPSYLYVFTHSHRVFAGVPPFNQSVILSMTDSNGISLPKTVKGLDLGQPLTLKPKTDWFLWAGNNRNPWLIDFNTAPHQLITLGNYSWHTNSEQIANSPGNKWNVWWLGHVIEPAEYFSIKVPGLYKLTIAVRLYVVNTNTYLKPITLPPVTVPVRVENGGE